MSIPPAADAPTLDTATTVAQFALLLRELHVRAGKPSLRQLEQWADRQRQEKNKKGVYLSRTTVSQVLAGKRFPNLKFVGYFLEACNVPADQHTAWQAAWQRVAVDHHIRNPPVPLPRPPSRNAERDKQLAEERTARETVEQELDRVRADLEAVRQAVAAERTARKTADEHQDRARALHEKIELELLREQADRHRAEEAVKELAAAKDELIKKLSEERQARHRAEQDLVVERSARQRAEAAHVEGGEPARAEPETEGLSDQPDRFLAAAPAGPSQLGTAGGFQVTLFVRELPRSLAFYRDTLGTLGLAEFATGKTTVVLVRGESRILLKKTTDPISLDRRVVHLNLEVPDVQAAYEELRIKGVEFVHKPRVVSHSEQLELWAATFRDPDGHAIALTHWEVTAERARSRPEANPDNQPVLRPAHRYRGAS